MCEKFKLKIFTFLVYFLIIKNGKNILDKTPIDTGMPGCRTAGWSSK